MNIPEPLFTGKKIIHLTETESTNTYAMDVVAKTNPSEGICILADYQTGGKGQIGRYWHSEACKNILVSYIFYPISLQVQDQFYLNIISGLAVRDVVATYVSSVKIKWPNDIYIEDRKIAGILVQNTLRETSIKSTIIGIGLNVNQTIFPIDIPNPTSLSLLTDKVFDIQEILSLLSSRLEFYYLNLKSGQHPLLMATYLTHLYRKDEWAIFKDDHDHIFKGKITGIEAQGRLKIELEDGRLQVFGFREISFVF
jgi:BirA family transcriptional regulator, biotin operon repressor / biotin---[acetyl-CoA-carboxylase] ligase